MPRRKPYSGKQKKAQLKVKRERKLHKEKLTDRGSRSQSSSDADTDVDDERLGQASEGAKQSGSPDGTSVVVTKLHQQPSHTQPSGYDPNKYKLQFAVDSSDVIASRKLQAQRDPIVLVPMEAREHSVEDFYPEQAKLAVPKRPPWDYSMSKACLEQREREYFEQYLKKMHTQPMEKLSFFEHNLETWRQLWRVLERSNVICLIADVRFAPLHFPPALFDYVTQELKKGLVLVLNKVDLVPPHVVVAWRHYFTTRYPSLRVVCFTSHPDHECSMQPQQKVHLRFRRTRGRGLSAVGPKELLREVVQIHSGQDIDLSDWEGRLAGRAVIEENPSDSPLDNFKEKEGTLTIGMVGFPNAGKSSIINGLLGKKAVSVSRTPGHTRHFQTIYLSDSIVLCDCPGLVFPAVAEKQLQVLSGIYPISQVREPYTIVGYLAQHVPLTSLLHLEHPQAELLPAGLGERDSCAGGDHGGQVWTAWDICDAWAVKKGYFTAKAARYDAYRAANSLLRLACDGRVCFYLCPPGFQKEKGEWEEHPEVAEMMELQRVGLRKIPQSTGLEEEEEESSSEEDECETKQPTSLANRFAKLDSS